MSQQAKKILITAGPTREYIDPVRFISNGSSGAMGIAVANEAIARGYDVTLLLGPVCLSSPAGATVKKFTSVDDLRNLLTVEFPKCDILVMAAAVGDFRVADRSQIKIRRSNGPVTLTLAPTEDLLAEQSARRNSSQLIIGFAVADVEPDKVAREKLISKKLDYVVVNTPAAMSSSDSDAAIIDANGFVIDWQNRPKQQLASEIVKLFSS